MKIIKPSVSFEHGPEYADALLTIERAARTCYKSEYKIADGSAEILIQSCIRRGHHSVLEHVSFGLRFICDRGVSHELVRHRLCAISQESTRYVRYGHIECIEPWWWEECTDNNKKILFRDHLVKSEDAYGESVMMYEMSPQAARALLPNALKTEVVVTANIREWRHIFQLRCDNAAHPDMRRVMGMAKAIASEKYPIFFEEGES